MYLHDSQGVKGFAYNNRIYHYVKNLFGDVTDIYCGSTHVVHYAYDAFGNGTVSHTLSNLSQIGNDLIGYANPFRYRSYLFDKDIGFYYLQGRYYDPQTGRFISPAKVSDLNPKAINGLNLYSFAGDNPIRCGKYVRFGNETINAYNGNNTVIGSGFEEPFLLNSKQTLVYPGIITKKDLEHISISYRRDRLFENQIAASILGNISVSYTHQIIDSDGFYYFATIGDRYSQSGVGFNYKNVVGFTAYTSNNIGAGVSSQLGSVIFGAEVSLIDGIGFSFGVTNGTDSITISINLSWLELALCFAVALIPVPGARAFSATMALALSVI